MSKKNIGLLIQTVLAICIVAFAILYFVDKGFLIVLQSLMSLFMFILAYNNHHTFKRSKAYTYTYIVVGFLIIGAVIF